MNKVIKHGQKGVLIVNGDIVVGEFYINTRRKQCHFLSNSTYLDGNYCDAYYSSISGGYIRSVRRRELQESGAIKYAYSWILDGSLCTDGWYLPYNEHDGGIVVSV